MLSATAVAADVAASFEVEFSHRVATLSLGAEGPRLGLPLPHLGGERTERIFLGAQRLDAAHGFELFQAGDLVIGCAVQPVNGVLADVTRGLYSRLLHASHSRSLYRIWNYVPAINEEVGGLENYRAFCAGRSEAFEAEYGRTFKRSLPAASAVGCSGESLAVIFVAGPAVPSHHENSEQVPAYEYPPEHGRRPPCFARATVATHGGRPLVFISGTAAIKGHLTVAPGSLREQLDCTLDNLAIIGRAAGVGAELGGPNFERHFKVYVRHAQDYDEVRARLSRDLFRASDRVCYLRAEVCRSALNLEIEATLLG